MQTLETTTAPAPFANEPRVVHNTVGRQTSTPRPAPAAAPSGAPSVWPNAQEAASPSLPSAPAPLTALDLLNAETFPVMLSESPRGNLVGEVFTRGKTRRAMKRLEELSKPDSDALVAAVGEVATLREEGLALDKSEQIEAVRAEIAVLEAAQVEEAAPAETQESEVEEAPSPDAEMEQAAASSDSPLEVVLDTTPARAALSELQGHITALPSVRLESLRLECAELERTQDENAPRALQIGQALVQLADRIEDIRLCSTARQLCFFLSSLYLEVEGEKHQIPLDVDALVEDIELETLKAWLKAVIDGLSGPLAQRRSVLQSGTS